jgi:hypothetical protein
MGGRGSGGHNHYWRPRKKTVVEDCLSLDANRWMREGILQAGVHRRDSWLWEYPGGQNCSIGYEVRTTDTARPWLRLTYSCPSGSTGQWESVEYQVRLATSLPRFGRLRWYFCCPLVVRGHACGRRVTKLYLPPGGRYFGCRKCHQLTYTSCQESHREANPARRRARWQRRWRTS